MTAVHEQTFDISGFGGGYEDTCQRMLWRGVAYLAEVKPDPAMWSGAKEYQNVYGLLITEGAELQALEKAIILPDDDATGAMHQAVMGHLRFIHLNGVDAWREHMRPHRTEPGGEFVWQGEI